MSDFAAVGLLMALGMLASCAFFFIHRHVRERRDVIISGVRDGIPMSVDERRVEFYREWLVSATALFVYQVIIFTGWMMMARSIDSDLAKPYAYLCAFFGFSGVVGAAIQGILSYLQIAVALRQAEAD